MSLIEAVKSGYGNYFNFRDRASRSEYWWWLLFSILAGFFVAVIEIIIGTYDFETGMGPIGAILTLVNIIPSISLAARRLHDVSRSGWWQLIWITVIGIPVLLYWYLKKGDEGSNHFGNNPLGSVTPSEHSDTPKQNTQARRKDAATPTQRINEDQLYEQVSAEMDSEDIKAGLWAKATDHAEGDAIKTKALYIRYRVQAIQDEAELLEKNRKIKVAEHLATKDAQKRDWEN
jgi:uncharacterized membrane protein YhaH (DUF805 family)